MDLLDEYHNPIPFPEDKFFELELHNYQNYVMFSSAMTGTAIFFQENYVPLSFCTYFIGTGMHADPLYTDAFNGLLKGKKWWVSMPKDLYEFPDEFSCLKHCSEELSVNYHNDVKLWYLHILPQLR